MPRQRLASELGQMDVLWQACNATLKVQLFIHTRREEGWVPWVVWPL